MRKIDDNIVYALNNSIPTQSFVRGEANPATAQCQELHRQLQSSYRDRENLIKNCIKHSSARVQALTQVGTQDASASKRTRSEQTQLRLLQKELNIEEVIQDRSTKAFYERCRPYFRAK